ncbi:VPEID-CTERM sorting domain-containing protein [Natronohydrobacter thiooxidans]|jgi:hypothetical protein|uniref:VPEID-CTERM sorting domain-containing protein n=1 Tax=Natronohydrobacter thiooxidans TaxID=87172 RepID=UPI000A853ACC|nr:VPEID-CTERM sorting domain-containing protein [Natronohydrobacter thiooxidans]
MFNFWNWFGSGGSGSHTNVAAVPEIDASTGLLAMAAVGAAVLFAWERRRRMAAGK